VTSKKQQEMDRAAKEDLHKALEANQVLYAIQTIAANIKDDKKASSILHCVYEISKSREKISDKVLD
jgi:hypothetical protein